MAAAVQLWILAAAAALSKAHGTHSKTHRDPASNGAPPATPSPKLKCFEGFDNFDECWQKIEEFCLNDDGVFVNCEEDLEIEEEEHEEGEGYHEHPAEDSELGGYAEAEQCYARLGVCLEDEYSSRSHCLQLAGACYRLYRRQACVHDILQCVSERWGDCGARAASCLAPAPSPGPACLLPAASCLAAGGSLPRCLARAERCAESKSCSTAVQRCFQYRERRHCRDMFRVCFYQEEEEAGNYGDHGDPGYHEEEDQAHITEEVGDLYSSADHEEDHHGYGAGGGRCLGPVRRCLGGSDDNGDCLDRLGGCLAAYTCSTRLVSCLTASRAGRAGRCHAQAATCPAHPRPCYQDIQQCLTVAGNFADRRACTALLPTCYARTEAARTQSCYTEARDCLEASAGYSQHCHTRLGLCLQDGGDVPAVVEFQEHGESTCEGSIISCLSNPEYCNLDVHLQNYLSDETCPEYADQLYT